MSYVTIELPAEAGGQRPAKPLPHVQADSGPATHTARRATHQVAPCEVCKSAISVDACPFLLSDTRNCDIRFQAREQQKGIVSIAQTVRLHT